MFSSDGVRPVYLLFACLNQCRAYRLNENKKNKVAVKQNKTKSFPRCTGIANQTNGKAYASTLVEIKIHWISLNSCLTATT